MKQVFYRKLFTRLCIAIILSYLIGELIYHSQIFFVFALAFFGGLFLLIGWVKYLQLDGVIYLNSKAFKSLQKLFKAFDRFSYKNKGVYNMDQESDKDDETNIGETKASLYAYVACGILLLIGSQIFTP